MLVQILNIQKSVSVCHILPTLFMHYIDIFPDRTFLDAQLIGFLYSRSLVDPLCNEEVFVSVFPSIGHSSTINNVIQAMLKLVVEIIEGLAFLGAGLNVATRFLTEGALSTVVWKVGVDGCRFSDIPLLWSVLGSGGNYCSSIVAWSG